MDDEYRIPPELAAAARQADRELTKASQVVEGKYLVQKHVVVLRVSTPRTITDLSVTTKDLIETLGVEKGRAFDSIDRDRGLSQGPHLPTRPHPDSHRNIANSLSRFIDLFYDQIVAIICKGDKKSLGLTTHGALVALAAWLAGHMGVDEKFSTPVATAILIAITRATKGAFCQMAAEDAKKAISVRAK